MKSCIKGTATVWYPQCNETHLVSSSGQQQFDMLFFLQSVSCVLPRFVVHCIKTLWKYGFIWLHVCFTHNESKEDQLRDGHKEASWTCMCVCVNGVRGGLVGSKNLKSIPIEDKLFSHEVFLAWDSPGFHFELTVGQRQRQQTTTSRQFETPCSQTKRARSRKMLNTKRHSEDIKLVSHFVRDFNCSQLWDISWSHTVTNGLTYTSLQDKQRKNLQQIGV